MSGPSSERVMSDPVQPTSYGREALCEAAPPKPKWSHSREWRFVVGIVLPIICFVIDPILFSRHGFMAGIGPLEELRVAFYAFVGLECVVLWLALAGRVGRPRVSAVAAGVLFAGGGTSLVLGVLMLPFTVIGVFMVVGVLGFTPFFTGFAYLRTAGLLVDGVAKASSGKRHWGLVIAGALCVILAASAVQFGVNAYTDHVMARLGSPDAAIVDGAISELERFGWLASANRMIEAHDALSDAVLERALHVMGVVWPPFD